MASAIVGIATVQALVRVLRAALLPPAAVPASPCPPFIPVVPMTALQPRERWERRPLIYADECFGDGK
jgi:hypothetical protein